MVQTYALCKPGPASVTFYSLFTSPTSTGSLTGTHTCTHFQAMCPPRDSPGGTAGSLSGGRVRIARSRCQPRENAEGGTRKDMLSRRGGGRCFRNSSSRHGMTPDPGHTLAFSRGSQRALPAPLTGCHFRLRCGNALREKNQMSLTKGSETS